ncbi:MAG: CsgG/HfaB family protein [Nitrospiraceae bacterium]
MKRKIATMGACLVLLFGVACAHVVYPVSTGSHAVPGPDTKPVKSVVVWSNDAGVGNTLISIFQKLNVVVVERAQLQQVFKEQQIRLTHTADDDADILRVGKLIGADRVVFAETSDREARVTSASVDKYGGEYSSQVVYHLRVAVRAVEVETGKIRWSGTAANARAVNNPEDSLTALAIVAVARAICPVEKGYVWVELSAESEKTGCTLHGKRVNFSERKEDINSIW